MDGTLVPSERAVVSVYDRGFLYGDAVFETIRTYAGEPFKLEEHAQRLAWSAERIGMALPLAPRDVVLEVRRNLSEIRAQHPEVGDLVARIMVTRGEGPFGLDPAAADAPRRVTFIHPYKPLPVSHQEDGVSVVTRTAYRPSDAAKGAKVGNYLESIVLLRDARAHGAHEASVVDGQGRVLEGTTSNVFAVKGAELLTPPTTLPLLPGITRGLVLEAAPEVGLVAVERELSVSDLLGADEVFITSSIREVLPVTRVDDRPIGSGRVGAKTRALHAAFRRRSGLPA
ncbi:MAG: branched-chain-amino acid aminotransferase [Polyangiaceae bacterium]|nr:branched-chain-amino acid aminotransferase [Polyangiaceae bacterium]